MKPGFPNQHKHKHMYMKSMQTLRNASTTTRINHKALYLLVLTYGLFLHMRYTFWYISLAVLCKTTTMKCEMAEFCIFWRAWTSAVNISYFYLELNTVFTQLELELRLTKEERNPRSLDVFKCLLSCRDLGLLNDIGCNSCFLCNS